MYQRMRRSRMFGWDGNPLRRRSDRAEGAMVAGLIVLFLAVAPVLTAVAGHWTSATGTRQQQAEMAWRRVSAVVQPGAAGPQDKPAALTGTVWRRARWTAPDGQARSGWVPVSPAAVAGSSARVWVSRSGSVTRPPLRRTQLQGWILLAEVLTPCLLAVMLFLAGRAGRFLFGWRHLAYWDRADGRPHSGLGSPG